MPDDDSLGKQNWMRRMRSLTTEEPHFLCSRRYPEAMGKAIVVGQEEFGLPVVPFFELGHLVAQP